MCLTLRTHVEPKIARLSSSYMQSSGDVLLGSSITVVPMDRMMEVLAQVQPGDALRLVQENLHKPMTGDRGGLLSFGIVAALWTSSSAITAIIGSLNRAYDLEEGRPFWKVCLMAILLAVGLSAFMIEQE